MLYALTALLSASPAAAWSSKDIVLFEPVHQNAISRVLAAHMSTDEIQALRDAQVVADQDQQAVDSHLHAMTGVVSDAEKPDKPKAQFVEKADTAVHDRLRAAIVARKAGNSAAAMAALGAALHILSDATSPAHTGFQPWSYDESLWQEALHVSAERVTPDDDPVTGYRAHLDAAIRWGYDVYQETIPMPERFFVPGTGALLLPPAYGVH